MAAVAGREDIAAALERLREAGLNLSLVEEPFREVCEGNPRALVAWARGRGEEEARTGNDVQQAVREALAVVSALGCLPGRPSEERLSAELVGAVVEGFTSVPAGTLSEDEKQEALQDRVAELTALHRINSAANSSLKLGDMLREVAQAVVAVTRADICTIFLYEVEWDQLRLAATSGENQHSVGTLRLRIGEGITGSAAMSGKPIAARDAWADPRFKYVPGLDEERAVSMLSVPVILYTKEKLVGVITVQTFESREFSENEIKFLETVAGEMAIAIENARLYEQTDSELRRKVSELATLQGVSAHIAATLDLQEALTLIAYQAAHLVNADASAIYELHRDEGTLELIAQYDLEDPNYSVHRGKLGPHPIVSIDRSAVAGAIMKGVPVALPADADALLGLPFARQSYGSMFCVPLVAPRAIMGGICLYNREARTFTEDQTRLLDSFGHEAAIALENSRLYDAAIRGLKTKSVMLQEMNHRVRNNLQTVAGLLSMQLRRMAPESEAAGAVRESVARIQSMAVVHDLMTSGDVESTTVYELARRVADAEFSTFSNPALDLKITIDPVEAESIRIGSHEATLLALLLNELISNAIMHGFEGQERGEITVRACYKYDLQVPGADDQATDGASRRIVVEVADNGSGLPAGFQPEQQGNLGLSILRTLVSNDLRGEFSISPRQDGPGTVARFSFRPTRQA